MEEERRSSSASQLSVWVSAVHKENSVVTHSLIIFYYTLVFSHVLRVTFVIFLNSSNDNNDNDDNKNKNMNMKNKKMKKKMKK